jgi:hypothetical protein
MLNSVCAEAESRVYKVVVETIASLDVDIMIRLRRGTHLVKTHHSVSNASLDQKSQLNNVLHKIESKELYAIRMRLRHQEEREIKVELLLK